MSPSHLSNRCLFRACLQTSEVRPPIRTEPRPKQLRCEWRRYSVPLKNATSYSDSLSFHHSLRRVQPICTCLDDELFFDRIIQYLTRTFSAAPLMLRSIFLSDASPGVPSVVIYFFRSHAYHRQSPPRGKRTTLLMILYYGTHWCSPTYHLGSLPPIKITIPAAIPL